MYGIITPFKECLNPPENSTRQFIYIPLGFRYKMMVQNRYKQPRRPVFYIPFEVQVWVR